MRYKVTLSRWDDKARRHRDQKFSTVQTFHVCAKESHRYCLLKDTHTEKAIHLRNLSIQKVIFYPAIGELDIYLEKRKP